MSTFDDFVGTAVAMAGNDISRAWLKELWEGADGDMNRAINHLLDTPEEKYQRDSGSAGGGFGSSTPPSSKSRKPSRKKKRNDGIPDLSTFPTEFVDASSGPAGMVGLFPPVNEQPLGGFPATSSQSMGGGAFDNQNQFDPAQQTESMFGAGGGGNPVGSFVGDSGFSFAREMPSQSTAPEQPQSQSMFNPLSNTIPPNASMNGSMQQSAFWNSGMFDNANTMNANTMSNSMFPLDTSNSIGYQNISMQGNSMYPGSSMNAVGPSMNPGSSMAGNSMGAGAMANSMTPTNNQTSNSMFGAGSPGSPTDWMNNPSSVPQNNANSRSHQQQQNNAVSMTMNSQGSMLPGSLLSMNPTSQQAINPLTPNQSRFDNQSTNLNNRNMIAGTTITGSSLPLNLQTPSGQSTRSMSATNLGRLPQGNSSVANERLLLLANGQTIISPDGSPAHQQTATQQNQSSNGPPFSRQDQMQLQLLQQQKILHNMRNIVLMQNSRLAALKSKKDDDVDWWQRGENTSKNPFADGAKKSTFSRPLRATNANNMATRSLTPTSRNPQQSYASAGSPIQQMPVSARSMQGGIMPGSMHALQNQNSAANRNGVHSNLTSLWGSPMVGTPQFRELAPASYTNLMAQQQQVQNAFIPASTNNMMGSMLPPGAGTPGTGTVLTQGSMLPLSASMLPQNNVGSLGNLNQLNQLPGSAQQGCMQPPGSAQLGSQLAGSMQLHPGSNAHLQGMGGMSHTMIPGSNAHLGISGLSPGGGQLGGMYGNSTTLAIPAHTYLTAPRTPPIPTYTSNMPLMPDASFMNPYMQRA